MIPKIPMEMCYEEDYDGGYEEEIGFIYPEVREKIALYSGIGFGM